MDAEKAFSYPFEDKDWLTKLGLGAIISVIPILNLAWSGYLVGIIRNVINRTGEPLPTWDDLDKKFTDGLILFGAGLIYASPILIALCLPLGIRASSGLFSGNSELQDIGRTLTEAGGVLFFCLLGVLLLYGLVLSILFPAILVLFAREGTFASCLRIREAFSLISRNATAFLKAWGFSLIAGIGVGLLVWFVSLVVGWIPCIGWIVGFVLSIGSGVYSTAVYAHLFGQFGQVTYERNPLVSGS